MSSRNKSQIEVQKLSVIPSAPNLANTVLGAAFSVRTDAVSELYNMDCVEGMKHYADNYFDLAICDPPYGINIGKKKTIGKVGKSYSTTNYKTSDWDSEIPTIKYFEELFRVSKNQIIFGANYFCHLLPPSQGWFIYDKRQPENFTMAHAELAFTSFNRSIRMKGFKRNEVQNCVSNNKLQALANAKIHQCQKPIPLYETLLKLYAEPNQKILDTHVGSGSSRIACYLNGFDFVGFEIDLDYCQKSEKRFVDAISQQRLF